MFGQTAKVLIFNQNPFIFARIFLGSFPFAPSRCFLIVPCLYPCTCPSLTFSFFLFRQSTPNFPIT